MAEDDSIGTDTINQDSEDEDPDLFADSVMSGYITQTIG